MENKTLLQKIRSVKYCLMAHPHNEPDSEFADRIDDLQEIEDSLETSPPIQTVEEVDDVNLLKRRLEFYRSETAKIRDYVFDDANKCGCPTQSIFEAITDKIDALKAEIAEHQARQQPVTNNLKINNVENLENNVVITGFSNPTSEGVVLHLNKPAKLKGGKMVSKEFYVSWDKIGLALFHKYADIGSV